MSGSVAGGDSFVHLHVHTEYSMLDGAARLDDLFTEKPNVMKGLAQIYASWITRFHVEPRGIDLQQHQVGAPGEEPVAREVRGAGVRAVHESDLVQRRSHDPPRRADPLGLGLRADVPDQRRVT